MRSGFNLTPLIVGLTAGLCLAGAARASEPAAAAGKTAIEDKIAACVACHGAKGISENPMYPDLAGQYADYLANALQDYKSGARKNPVMAGMAAPLSKQDIQAIARWYAAQPGKLYTPALE